MSGIAGRGDSSLIRPVPDAETLPILKRRIPIEDKQCDRPLSKKKLEISRKSENDRVLDVL